VSQEFTTEEPATCAFDGCHRSRVKDYRNGVFGKHCHVHSRPPIAGFINRSWVGMNTRAANGTHREADRKYYDNVMIMVSRADFAAWCRSQEAHILSLERPSIDRIDPRGHYELKNMQVIEFRVNCGKDKKSPFENGRCVCRICRVEKNFLEFAKDSSCLLGRSSRCTVCERNRMRAARQQKRAVSLVSEVAK
jgi:hypothetical protein